MRSTNRSRCSVVRDLQHAHGTHSHLHIELLHCERTNTIIDPLTRPTRFGNDEKFYVLMETDGAADENEEMIFFSDTRHQVDELFIFIIHLPAIAWLGRCD